MARTRQTARKSNARRPTLLITDASTQVFHQLCQINSESPKSNDLTQRMLPYANVHKLVKLWILKDMMPSNASITTPEPSDDNTLKEHLHHLPHEIQFEIIKYIPTHSTFDNNRDEWWVTYLKHRLISSSIRQHAEREIMTRWNREGLNLSRFLYSTNTINNTMYRAFQVLAKLLKYHQLYHGSSNQSLPPLTFTLDEEMEEEENEKPFYYRPPSRLIRKAAPSVPATNTEDDFMKQQLESALGGKQEMMADEIMHELDGKAVKDFTFEQDENYHVADQPIEFYTDSHTHQKSQISYGRNRGYNEPVVEFADNYFIKELIIPVINELNHDAIALIASLKALETLHIVYYGRDVHNFFQNFTYCHAKTIKLTFTSAFPFADVIHSLRSEQDDDDDDNDPQSNEFFKNFPNLTTVLMEGVEPNSFSMDSIHQEDPFPSMEFHMANQHMGSYASADKTRKDRLVQVHLSEFHAISIWNTNIQNGIYINPFYMGNALFRFNMENMMDQVLSSVELTLNEKKQFIEEVMRHPGRGSMSCEVTAIAPHNDSGNKEQEEAKRLERKCLHQWSIYCLNKYQTYKLLDGFEEDHYQQKSRDYHMAQCLLYGWNPEYNLLEALVGVSSYKLAQPLIKMVEEKLQANSGAFPLKDVQQVVGILLRKRNCLDGVKLIELVKKYHVDGCQLFKPVVRNGKGLLHSIFCMDLPLVAMEKILQHVTPDDLLYVTKVERDKVTVLTLGLYSQHLTNEFLLKMIEKQPMLAHLPIYDHSDDPPTKPTDDDSDDDFDDDDLPSLGKRSLLHYVVSDMRRWELIQILVDKYGCGLNVRDLSERTPRDVALMLLDGWHLPLDCLPPCLQ